MCMLPTRTISVAPPQRCPNASTQPDSIIEANRTATRVGAHSSFANLPEFVAEQREPTLIVHPDDAASRGIADGAEVRIHNNRGAFRAKAVVSDRARPGVVVAPSIWWRKLSPDGQNANAVTGQALTDMGRAATFYDCLVEVSLA